MKPGFKTLILSTLMISQFALAGGNKHADPVGDVDIKPMACPDLQTDLVSTDFNCVGDEIVVDMEMTKEIQKNIGYKEYYFWLDLTHDTQRGYQPYNPDSVAWPDLYANYRVFYSIDANDARRNGYASERVTVQNCLETNCAQDEGMRSSSQVKISIDKKVVTFRFPVSLFPELENSKKIRIGYTTYFDFMQCNGEDDSPQWGQNAFKIKLDTASEKGSATIKK